MKLFAAVVATAFLSGSVFANTAPKATQEATASTKPTAAQFCCMSTTEKGKVVGELCQTTKPGKKDPVVAQCSKLGGKFQSQKADKKG